MYCFRNGEHFQRFKNLNEIDKRIFTVYVIKRRCIMYTRRAIPYVLYYTREIKRHRTVSKRQYSRTS